MDGPTGLLLIRNPRITCVTGMLRTRVTLVPAYIPRPPQPAGRYWKGQHGSGLADHERLPVAGVVCVAPPALQLPAGAHNSELREALPPVLSVAVPGTSFAVRQVPLTWLTTNACPWLELSV